MTTYTSKYPLAYSISYCLSTTVYSAFYAHSAFNPANSLTGGWGAGWLSNTDQSTNQKINADLGAPYIINRVYIENQHDSGGQLGAGVKNVVLYGTNSPPAFVTSTYADTTDLTEIASFQVAQHVAADTADPQYFTFENTTAYRYYVLAIADNWGSNFVNAMGIRRLEYQVDDSVEQPIDQYTPHYPSEYTDTYVKATSNYTGRYPYLSTNPALSLIGSDAGNQWHSSSASGSQKFNIDCGEAFVASRIYIENSHITGTYTGRGAKNVLLYGTNSATAFANTTYADTTDLTLLGTYQFSDHIAYNAEHPQYFAIEGNATAFRYYILRIVDSWGDGYVGLRHIEIQSGIGTTPYAAVRAIFDQRYDLINDLVRAIFDQVYHLTDRQINTLIQVYGLKMLATLIQPYGDMPRRRAVFDQMYGDCLPLRRLLDLMYGDMPTYRAEFDQQWVMLQDLRAELVERYHIAADQVRAIFDSVYGLPEHDRVVVLLDQLYVLAAGEAIVQQTAISIMAETDGVSRTISSAFNINIEQDDSIYHMTGELQLADQEDFIFCWAIKPGVSPSTVTVTIDGDEYSYIVERKQKARSTEGVIYAVVLASPTLLLGHKDSAYSATDETMLSGMAKTIVDTLASPVCTVDWRLVDWYIPPNRLYINGRTRIEVIRQIVEAVGGILQTGTDGTLICRPEYPVDVNQWATAAADIELADQDNFFSIMPSDDPRDGFNKFFIADQQLGESGERIDDEAVSTYGRRVMAWYVPWADITGMRLHHSGGDWITVVENGIDVETITEQVEIVEGQGRVSKPCYGEVVVEWLQQDLGAVTIEEDGTVTTATPGNSLASISYRTQFYSWNVCGDRVEDVQVYTEVLS